MGFVDLAWGIALGAWALIAGTAVALVGMGPSEFRRARFLFWASAAPLIGVDIMWVLMTDKPSWERLLVSGIVGAVALITVTEALRWANHREELAAKTEKQVVAKPEAKTKPPDRQGRVFVGESITAEYLQSFFNDHTDIQADKLTQAYMGKWMRVTGELSSVMSSALFAGHIPTKVQVTFKHGPLQSYEIFMMFERATWFDRLAILRRGDKISVIGQIERIDKVSIQLANCELVDAQ